MDSSVHRTENLLLGILLQRIVVIAAAHIGNQVMRRLGQLGVLGGIPAGLFLGSSPFGYFFPDTLYLGHRVLRNATASRTVKPS